jgi:hypothetical protein
VFFKPGECCCLEGIARTYRIDHIDMDTRHRGADAVTGEGDGTLATLGDDDEPYAALDPILRQMFQRLFRVEQFRVFGTQLQG